MFITRLTLLVSYLVFPLTDLPSTNKRLLKLMGFCRFYDLTNVEFNEANLRGVDLYYSNLSGAELNNADL